MLKCPEPSCPAAVGQDMFEKLASKEDKEKYYRYFIRSYVEDNRKVRQSKIAFAYDIALVLF